MTLLAGICLTIISSAANQEWNPFGNPFGPTYNWNTAEEDANWDDGVVWTQGNNAIFGGFFGDYVTLSTGISVGNMTFDADGYNIYSDTLTLASGSIISIGDTYTATIGSVIAGSTGFTKSGAGTLTLTGANTNTGAITINGGTLNIIGVTNGSNNGNVNGNQLATTKLDVAAGATVALNTGGNFSSANTGTTLSGAGVIQLKSGEWWLGNGGGTGAGTTISMATGGFIDVQNGALLKGDYSNVNWSANLGSLNVATGGSFDLRNNNATVDALTGNGTIYDNGFSNTLTIGSGNTANNAVYSVSLNTATFYGAIGTGGTTVSLTKIGTGTQILSGANTHTGTTTVNAGTLVLQNSIGWNSNTTLGASGTPTLRLDAPLATDAWSFSKPISGTNTAAKVEKTGAGSVSFPTSQAYTAPTAVSAGKLMLASPVYGTALPSIPGMKVWLDAGDINGDGNYGNNPATGTGVATWTNKGTLGAAGNFAEVQTGGSPTLTASNASFNTKPTVTFSAAGKQLANTTNFTNTVSVVYVGKIGATKQRLVSGNTVNWILGYWNGNMNTNYWNGGSLGSAADTNPHIWINGATAGANPLGYRFDAGGETALGNGSNTGPTGGLMLGGGWSGAEKSDGDIAELFVFDHQLTTTERQQLEGYLYNKYFGTPYAAAISLNAASPVSVAANATFGGYGNAGNVTVATGGAVEGGNNGSGTLTIGSLTFSGMGTARGALATGVTPIVITGALTTFGGANSISVTPANLPPNGTYHFFQFGSYPGTISNFKFAEPQRSMTLAQNGNFIDVVVNGTSNYPIWTGVGGGEWSYNTGLGNWKLFSDSSVTDFMAFDNTLFNDTATGTTNIVVGQSNINAGVITFN
ncbi:MAG TPA: autotransporter-associated beta strand repeat-containing protein, partial [Luteolibacter sp.]